jgi:hypothetical protein
MWECDRCTFCNQDNAGAAAKCAMCSFERGQAFVATEGEDAEMRRALQASVEHAAEEAEDESEEEEEDEDEKAAAVAVRAVMEQCKITRGAAAFQLAQHGGKVKATVRAYLGTLAPKLKPFMLKPPVLAKTLSKSLLGWYGARSDAFKDCVKLVAEQHLIPWTVKFLEKRAAFADARHSNKCHIMYHWTSSQNQGKVSDNGLLTRACMRAKGVNTASMHGQVFGDGIYLGNTPYDFAGYGDLLLVCIVVLGKHQRNYGYGGGKAADVDTVVGNKGSEAAPRQNVDEVVVQRPEQCIPAFLIPRSKLKRQTFEESEARLCGVALESILEDFFTPLEVAADHPEYDRMEHASANSMQRTM